MKMEFNSNHRKKWMKFYWSKEWRALRSLKIQDNPLCEECERNGKLTPGHAVDHIIPVIDRPDLALDYDNLQTLCTSCHSRKTILENAESMKQKPPIDPMAEKLKGLLK
jgi:5-methylcytosine-specific restriction protein A